MNYALTVYPLSGGLRSRLQQELSTEPICLSLSELRRQPVLHVLKRLRSLKNARLIIQLEDERGQAILPVLKAVAACSNARQIELRGPHMQTETLDRWRLLLELGALARASATSARDAWLCSRELSHLLQAPHIQVHTPGPHIPRAHTSGAQTRSDGQVLYINANLWFGVKAGGSLGHVAGVVNALGEHNYDVLYATAGGRTMVRQNIPLFDLTPPKVFSFPYELNYYTFNRMVVEQLGGVAPPQFIYQRMSISNYSGVALSRQWNVPLVLEYNGSEVWIAKHWGLPLKYHDLAVRAEEACLRHAHVIVTISDVLRDELIGKGVEPARIVSYPNCIDPTVFDPSRFSSGANLALRKKLGIAADAVLATFIGTFGQWHGAEVLAQAIRQLVDEQHEWLSRSHLHFLLVGDGIKMPLVRDILGGKHCDRFVTLTGLVPQADAPGYLAASDVLLSPHVANADGTRFFGSPTKLFEYMAMEKAIVASDLDQIGEVLRESVRLATAPHTSPTDDDTRLAVLTAPGDPTSLSRAIRFVVDRPEWRRHLGRNARREALAKYTWSHHVDAILTRLHTIGVDGGAR